MADIDSSTHIHGPPSGNKSEVVFLAPQKGPTLPRSIALSHSIRAIKKDPINVQGGKKAKRLFADDGRKAIRLRKKVLAQSELLS